MLKRDLFGQVLLIEADGERRIRRDTRCARHWTRLIARWLARREARALERVSGLSGMPALLRWDGDILERSWIDGQPMQEAKPADPAYFRHALHLLRRLHRAGVAHNDLAKEPNWLVTPDGRPALVDFQLASCSPRRGAYFRLLAREDIRHLLKHKRGYCPDRLTARQRVILSNPSLLSRTWMATGKRIYMFVTRKIFRWRDREGANDRQL